VHHEVEVHGRPVAGVAALRGGAREGPAARRLPQQVEGSRCTEELQEVVPEPPADLQIEGLHVEGRSAGDVVDVEIDEETGHALLPAYVSGLRCSRTREVSAIRREASVRYRPTFGRQRRRRAEREARLGRPDPRSIEREMAELLALVVPPGGRA